ncbi:efflux transporter outer membrane subunit [Helicobacter apodemus]|uniref:Efflux transporter outer membrane subunit n=1 Tax=Helicobacter apodemus TaxID=135569 RepID=A0A4U8UF80_9HELI|nr:efflux transporter outer membrane subunit [Helicobacter apodemus]TLE16118.1 efflux transporter outer membrane subunit [Helicobacter apodemus]
MNHIISIICFAFLLASCSLSPNYHQPVINLPQYLGLEPTEEKISETWWKDFGDSTLDLFVQEALENNYDLALAMSRVSQARSSWSYARSDRYPNIKLQGEATRNKKDSNKGQLENYNNFSLSGVVSFELDLWGRARDADRKAYATLLSIKANQDAIKLSLIANVVESYFGILTLNNQIQISQNTLKAREENYQYRKKEFEVGQTSEIIMQQAKSEVASVKAQLQSLLKEQNAAQTALLILLGRDPEGIFNVEIPTQPQTLPNAPIVPIGLPSSILEQRPDIEAATQNLKAANFAIGIARSAYFPTISLTGLAGYVSPELNNLIQNSSSTSNYGGNFVSNLLDLGRTNANINLAKAQYQEMLLTYGQTINKAFGEVRDSLFNYSISNERIQSLNEQVEALKRALVLAQIRYEEGYTNYLEVLTTQSNLFAAELNQQSVKLENLSAAVNLYKTLGGGWNKEYYDKD